MNIHQAAHAPWGEKFLGASTALCLLFVLFTTAATISPENTFAEYIPLAPLPNLTTAGEGDTIRGTLPDYVAGGFRIAIAVAGVLAFLMIVWGGITYMSTDAVSGKEEGREKIKNAVGGLILALAAYLILVTVNPQLVDLKITRAPLKSIAPPGGGGGGIGGEEPVPVTGSGNFQINYHTLSRFSVTVLNKSKTPPQEIKNDFFTQTECQTALRRYQELIERAKYQERINPGSGGVYKDYEIRAGSQCEAVGDPTTRPTIVRYETEAACKAAAEQLEREGKIITLRCVDTSQFE